MPTPSALWRRPLEDVLKEYFVYLLYADGGVLLYVGITNCISVRFRQHHETAHWWHEVTEVSIETVVNENAARRLERHYIRTRSPRHNRPPRSRNEIWREESLQLRQIMDASRRPSKPACVTVGELVAESKDDDE